jgi:hypothetical protein
MGASLSLKLTRKSAHHLKASYKPRCATGSNWPIRQRLETTMPAGSSKKRERQYEHIKEGLVKRGKKTDTAEEIAARTVNKERAQHGEAKKSSPQARHDTPAPVRGGQRSHRGEGGRTREQLYEEAKRKGISGRSTMNKAQLERAVGR